MTSYAAAAHTNGYEFSSGSGYELPTYAFVAPPELSQPGVVRHAVVIVGAGLAGLTLAASLASFGVRSVLIDEDNTVGVKGASSRGICYAQKSLEIFKRLGIFERIAAKGIQWSVGRTFAGLDEVYSFDLKDQNTHNRSTLPPFVNIQQFYVEGFLVERVLELGLTDVRWLHRVSAFEQTADVARLTLDTPAGAYTIEAEHVIDASGSKSPFRQWLGASVTAKRGDDRWCIADVRFKNAPPVERHTWIEAPFNDNRAVWQHLMADGVWRLDYQMAPNCDMQAVSSMEVVQERLQRQFAGHVDIKTECEIVWVGPYAYKSECLDQLQHGRVLSIGDSAHVVSPFGARGGNSGIQDADNLAWKLCAVSRRLAPPALLASYHHERHQAAKENVSVTNRTAKFLRPADSANGAQRLFRTAAIELAKRHPALRAYVNTGRMSTPNTYAKSPVCTHALCGAAQNVAFQWADGTHGELIDLVNWANGRMLLLWFGQLTLADIASLNALAKAQLRAVQVLESGQMAQTCEAIWELSTAQNLRTSTQADGARWSLIRPDSYVAATGQSAGEIESSLNTAFANAKPT